LKKTDHQRPHSPTGQAPQERQGAFNEARQRFERMKGEAERHSTLEREEARSRGPFTRILLVLTIAACLLAGATMVYGVYNFPDAPIRQTGGGYAGKGGKPHTKEDYEAFVRWEKAMFIVFPSAFLLGFVFGITDARQRRKRKSSER
jgi:hypothetical protein